MRDKRAFEELGVLDTIGYVDFANSQQLADRLVNKLPGSPLAQFPTHQFDEPLYVVKGRVETEGAIRLMSTLKKSGLHFRAYDPIETPRLSLPEVRRQVSGSHGVVAHLLSPHRDRALSHNALCAFISGVAMAQQKAVLMLQEEDCHQPIDYRDVVRAYSHPDQIPGLLETLIREIVSKMQVRTRRVRGRDRLLEKLDLGDTAAENEIGGLKSYFVRTGQFTQAKQGHARLVVGRKGTGKTAIFYGTRDFARQSRHTTILDLKPEGHQFTRLRETVLSSMSSGLQEHSMTAFWNYVLLTEFARKIVYNEQNLAFRDTDRQTLFEGVKKEYEVHDLGRDEDFSQRLLHQTNKLGQILEGVPPDEIAGRITQELYSDTIHNLGNAVAAWLEEKEACWLLIDNIDKGWPTKGTTSADITIVRALLEATRKLQRQLQARNVELKCLVFLRSDIHEHLIRETSDRGKDTAIVLEWDDPEVFQEMVRTRIVESTNLDGNFTTVWRSVFESHVGAQDSFIYMIERTLMRPRDLLGFLHRALEVALNRNHTLVSAADIQQAERSFSEDLLLTTAFEIDDTYPEYSKLLYQFEGRAATLSKTELDELLNRAGIDDADHADAVELLLWFAFLGVQQPGNEFKFSYHVRHNVQRLKAVISGASGIYVVHPGFRRALDIS